MIDKFFIEQAKYDLASEGGTERLHVVSDGKKLGTICKNPKGWQIENEDDNAEPITFDRQQTAAHFVWMRGRYCHFFLDCRDGRIEIRVSPNFGEWVNCKRGQWVASLHSSEGKIAGASRCADFFEEAKLAGLQQASLHEFPNYILKAHALSDWPIV